MSGAEGGDPYVYATDSMVLKPPSTTSLMSRADRPATPYHAGQCWIPAGMMRVTHFQN